MTEAEWLACVGPGPMLSALRSKVSDRKLRLFACACCRRVWHLLTDERSRWAVELAESRAEGKVGFVGRLRRGLAWGRALAVVQEEQDKPEARAALLALESWDDPIERVADAVRAAAIRLPDAERTSQAHLLRCIVADPFRPVPSIAGSWLAWNGGAVYKLAEAIYEERAFDRLPILADALEDAGCTDAAILDHCRGPGPHVRGCWVVDLLLGKQ
jgi:hypothetical protein